MALSLPGGCRGSFRCRSDGGHCRRWGVGLGRSQGLFETLADATSAGTLEKGATALAVVRLAFRVPTPEVAGSSPFRPRGMAVAWAFGAGGAAPTLASAPGKLRSLVWAA